MELYPTFPTCREDTPKRQAEKQIYEAFKSCDFDGRVLYEVRPLHTAPQLDFAVWIVGVGIWVSSGSRSGVGGAARRRQVHHH